MLQDLGIRNCVVDTQSMQALSRQVVYVHFTYKTKWWSLTLTINIPKYILFLLSW